ncbi:contact-dependent growth inhibition system immunity protein [Xanthomonas sacchari]|uniref:contact-dependent growth inhibition system immunity protein n=1 Tax=Xanthomonas sacchari TaxID=56458 RepID=UPI0022526A7D|nr:contact-dependent growth inhibition system immunity protein [Xanthomonas sacchari]
MKKSKARVSVGFNGDFFVLVTMSLGMMGYAEPDVLPKYILPVASDAELGAALRLALGESKQVSAEDFQRIIHSGIVQNNAKERDALAMKKYGYKTRRAMYQNMDECSVDVFDDKIEIQPMHQRALDGYTARKDTGPFPISVSLTANDVELGAALREGFRRCTSAIR